MLSPPALSMPCLLYTSSAKGGLAVAALGLVPSITLETAKVTAHSAGAKIAQYYSYKLNRRDIQALEETQPDILLFTGGTDGGEESYGLNNARVLAESKLDCAIIYAGTVSYTHLIGTRTTATQVMTLSVSWLEVASHIVRLAFILSLIHI